MHKPTLTLVALIVAFASQTLLGRATPATTTSSSGGVTVSLTASGFQFTPHVGGPVPVFGTTPPAQAPQVFSASVVLKNGTSSGIACTLSETGTPGQRFEFTVSDANGNVVWDSLPKVQPPLTVQLTLGAGDSWRGSASVPLFVNGQPLPAGTYTLQATLYGSPSFAAVTSFVVNYPIVLN